MKTTDLKAALQNAADDIVANYLEAEQKLADAKGAQALAAMHLLEHRSEIAHACYMMLIPLQALVSVHFMQTEQARYRGNKKRTSTP